MNKMIFVIEDDESIRELIKLTLTSFSYDVEAFDNAEDALKAIAQSPPDLAIFDIMLPGMSGTDATARLRKSPKTKGLPIVLLTAKSAEMDKVSGLDCGADDYIVKPFSAMELAARLRALLRRAPNESPRSLEEKTLVFSGLSINHNTREVTKDGKPVNLTFKEYELLRMLVDLKDRIVSREELLDSVWGSEFEGESRTLDMHIRTLRAKLGDAAEAPKYIKTIRGVGYRFIGK
ncbi:MAG: response regulator transcription factor [Clostridiales Family XIII bacterium]|jgi:two-component system alkaline phosphatase synthesis response regulator PhoP|nr:response regulator transcription factor [Clostridiales Family XIII bacterium]